MWSFRHQRHRSVPLFFFRSVRLDRLSFLVEQLVDRHSVSSVHIIELSLRNHAQLIEYAIDLCRYRYDRHDIVRASLNAYRSLNFAIEKQTRC